VGSAVVRNRVKRRLRALAAARLDELPQAVDDLREALTRFR
jgi:ribonuclease P protein component